MRDFYVLIDGAWHAIAGDKNETTECGIVVPHGMDFVRTVPADAKAHCGPQVVEAAAKPAPKKVAAKRTKATKKA